MKATCKHCHDEFEAKTTRRRFCSAKCRSAAWQDAKRDQDARVRGLVKALAKLKGMQPADFA